MRQRPLSLFFLRIAPPGLAAAGVLLGTAPRLAGADAPATPPVRPRPEQAAWQELGLAARVPFGLGPFLGTEMGRGHEDPALFLPAEFDARQWVRALRAGGARLVILTAKQRDGFCLWPSRWTEQSVKHSPWRHGRGDVIREVALACREAGLRFGLEYALCDHHEPAASNPAAYDQFLQRQLAELLTDYGPLTELWLDADCPLHGRKVTGRIDWRGLLRVARHLQPQCLLAGAGPDIRSLPLTAVLRRDEEGSVWPLDPRAPWADEFAGRTALWRPLERRAGLRPSLYYRARENNRQRAVRQLLEWYQRTVGRNASLLLSVPVDARGLIPEPDVRRLAEFGAELRRRFGAPLAETSGAGRVVELKLDPARPAGAALAAEDLRGGERVRRFLLEGHAEGRWQVLLEGRRLGSRQLVSFRPRPLDAVRVRVLEHAGAAPPRLRRLAVFPPPDATP